jgi:hypothetical protein
MYSMPSNTSRGLESLVSLDQILIKQEVSLIEGFSLFLKVIYIICDVIFFNRYKPLLDGKKIINTQLPMRTIIQFSMHSRVILKYFNFHSKFEFLIVFYF